MSIGRSLLRWFVPGAVGLVILAILIGRSHPPDPRLKNSIMLTSGFGEDLANHSEELADTGLEYRVTLAEKRIQGLEKVMRSLQDPVQQDRPDTFLGETVARIPSISTP